MIQPATRPRRRKDVNAAVRANTAIGLRCEGLTYEAIARQCGFTNRNGAFQAVQRELGRTLQESADELRTLEGHRLDDLYRVMAAKALKGDTWAVDRCLAIMTRRAALFGLDMARTGDAITAPLVVIREVVASTEAL